jgi:TRAP-type mannitol/chloroaromatic compound transport system permease small subunit
MRKILRVIDTVNETVGSVSGWLVIAMVIVILWEVVSRYVFNSPTTWAFDGMRLIGGAIIVIGWAYAQLHNEHIRVDIFYTRLSARKRAVVDIVGSVLFFFPLLGVVTYIVVLRELDVTSQPLRSGNHAGLMPYLFSIHCPAGSRYIHGSKGKSL